MKLSEATFLEDVQDHKMIVLRDDGVYRHIRFKAPDTGRMHFDLVTWPGYLAYSGDMGCYVFSRTRDMFEFFRSDRSYAKRTERQLCVNHNYWSEKIQSKDRDGVEEFSEEKFTTAVMECLVSWIRQHAKLTTKEERRDLWDAVIDEVINADGDSGGYRKQAAAHDFYRQVNDLSGNFSLCDFWETDCREYTHRFQWCCFALAWGIELYDTQKELAKELIPA